MALRKFGEGSTASDCGYDVDFMVGWLENMVDHESNGIRSYKGSKYRRLRKVEEALQLLYEVSNMEESRR